jgi:hypothetical protein
MKVPTSARDVSTGHCRGGVARDLIATLDIFTKEAENRLGSAEQTIFFLGDGLQRVAADLVFDFFDPKTWAPTNVARLTAITRQQAMLTMKLIASPHTARRTWLEMLNKLEIFNLVQNASSILGVPDDRFLPLPELVEKAYSLSPFQALWALEGMGEHYTKSYWTSFGPPKGLLFQENAPVPEKSLLMLHAGMGLFFANYLMGAGTPALTPVSPPGAFKAVVHEFVRLARDNARPGYLGPVIESLGLDVRDFYPKIVQGVRRALLEVAPELVGYYWHGVGRALYFSRRYFLPVLGTVWAGVDNEVCTAPERLNAIAGLTWAVVLVNMRQPEIVESALQMCIANSPPQEGFANGVASSLVMRQSTTPNAPFISALGEYRPPEKSTLALWEELVAQPARDALNEYEPVLRRHDATGEVFRFQDLPLLVSRLNQTPPAGLPGTVALGHSGTTGSTTVR